jgi:hypothetical protein
LVSELVHDRAPPVVIGAQKDQIPVDERRRGRVQNDARRDRLDPCGRAIRRKPSATRATFFRSSTPWLGTVV